MDAVTISAPRGLLKLVSLQLFSESSLSGAELQEEIRKTSEGVWKPGPGSIYFLLEELRKGELHRRAPAQGRDDQEVRHLEQGQSRARQAQGRDRRGGQEAAQAPGLLLRQHFEPEDGRRPPQALRSALAGALTDSGEHLRGGAPLGPSPGNRSPSAPWAARSPSA